MPTNVYPEASLELLERIEKLEKLFASSEGISGSWSLTGLAAVSGGEVTINLNNAGTYLFVQGVTGFTETAPASFAVYTYLDGERMDKINVAWQNKFFHNANNTHHRYNDLVAILNLTAGAHKIKWESSPGNVEDGNDLVTGFIIFAQGIPGPEGKQGKEGKEGGPSSKEVALSEATYLEGVLPGKAPASELSWWKTLTSEIWASLVTWWNAKEETFVSRWHLSGEVNEVAGKGLNAVAIALVNNLKTKIAEVKVHAKGAGLLILNSNSESAWMKTLGGGRKSVSNYGISVVTWGVKSATATEEINVGFPSPTSLIATALSPINGQYIVCVVEFTPLEELNFVKIIVRNLLGESAAGTKVTVYWMAFGTG